MRKSRKQLLISSVSMLLVAILSLSVATYAWFAQREVSIADGIYIRTKTPDILLSLDNTDESVWTSKLSLGVYEPSLKPVSTVDCKNWFTSYSQKYDARPYENKGRGEIKEVTGDGKGYYVAKEFYIKAPNVEEPQEALIANYVINVQPYNGNVDDDTQIEYLRVAMIFETYTTSGAIEERTSRFYSYDYDNEALISTDGDIGYVKAVTDRVTGNIRLKANTPQKITLYAWYEGEDFSCIDSASGVLSSIDVAFTKANSEGS